MVTDSGSEDRILVAIHEKVALIRLQGHVSFKHASALKAFGGVAMAQGCREFLFDFAGCDGMDSTFMGVIAGVALRLTQGGGSRPLMMNLSPKTKGLLTTLGLDRLAECHLAGERNGPLASRLKHFASPRRLETLTQDRQVTLETMLSAHEDLVRVDPGNLPKFRNVIDYLSRDLDALGA